MRWTGGRRSSNIEDRRGMRISRKAAGGGIGTIILVLVALYFGVDPSILLQGGGTLVDSSTPTYDQPLSAEEEKLAEFVSVVLADTEDTWNDIFSQSGSRYSEPKLVLFSGAVESACGYAQSATGPFYCPADQKVYLDLNFFQELHDRFKAPGDFAQAYVIAHEIGHHVQNLTGTLPEVHTAMQRLPQKQANALLVRLELQADCYAGVWANHANRARQIIEQGDLEEAFAAVNAVGDDRLQKQAQGYVIPDSFTHGTSAQRMNWFKTGLTSGSVTACDTFNTRD